MKANTEFGTGSWVGGGFGVDLGETHYEGGGSSHNGIKVFEKHENKILKDLLDNDEWIECMPTSEDEVLDLYDEKKIDRPALLKKIGEFLIPPQQRVSKI